MASIDLAFQEDHLQHIVEARIEQYDVVEIFYPDDAYFKFRIGVTIESPTYTPLTGTLDVGETIVDKKGANPDSILVEVLFDAGFNVGSEITGKWLWGFWYLPPVLFTAPHITVVDEIDPNPFHDSAQEQCDIWTEFWTEAFQTQYSNAVEGLSDVKAAFELAHNTVQYVELAKFSDGVKDIDFYGTSEYTYNYGEPVLHSATFNLLEWDETTAQLSNDIPYAYAETTPATGPGGFSFTGVLQPVQTTVTEGQYWVSSYMRREVYIVNKRKLQNITIDIVISGVSEISPSVAMAQITHYKACSGNFTAAADRKLTFGGVGSTAVKSVSFAGEDGSVLAAFDRNGFIS